MNPFLHDTVARPQPRATFSELAPSRSRRRMLARAVGRIAMAGGLGLAMAPAHALDVNSASAEQLEALRGVGPKTAQIIVQERTRGGRFESLEDLSDRVRGIGPKRAQALQAAGLRVGGGAPGQGAAVVPPAASAHGTAAAATRPPAASQRGK
jgi:competence protein ComEA